MTTLKVAHTQNYVPYDFVDEKGESDGYEVAVLKAIDEKLPDYKFEYTGTSDDDLLIGLESGKVRYRNQRSLVYRRTRQEIYHSKEPIGASIIGFTVRKKMRINTRTLMTLRKKRKIGSNFTTKCAVECY